MKTPDSLTESKKFFLDFVLKTNEIELIEAFKSDWFNRIIPGAKDLIGCDQGTVRHFEGDAAAHTGLVFKNFIECAWKRFSRKATFIELLSVIVHDLKKPETRVEHEGGNVLFPGHEKLAADQSVPIVAKNLDLSELELEELDFLVRFHGYANGWLKLDVEIKNKILKSRWRNSLALLQEADAFSCLMADGGCALSYWDEITA